MGEGPKSETAEQGRICSEVARKLQDGAVTQDYEAPCRAPFCYMSGLGIWSWLIAAV